MMRLGVVLMLCCLQASLAVAAPSKKDAAAFVKEVEAAVKGNKKVLKDGSPSAISSHNLLYRRLHERSRALFVDADACSFAVGSADVLWADMRRYAQQPDQVGHRFVIRHTEDYQDNMKLCKESLRALK